MAIQPPSGGCVLKLYGAVKAKSPVTAAFRRLCVETDGLLHGTGLSSSRLQAAVC